MKTEYSMSQRIRLAVLALCCVLLQACVAVQSFPTAARAGDTITLALGSVDGLNKSNLTVHYTPLATGVSIDLTPNIRSVFKVYPDKTSRVWLDTDDSANILNVFTGHGAWLNVAVLDLPATLPAGAGYFQVDFDESVVVPNTFAVQSAESVSIFVDILPVAAGAGLPSGFDYHSVPGVIDSGDLSRLGSLDHVVLRPKSALGYTSQIKPAAAEYRIRLPVIGDPMAIEDSSVHVIWDDKPGEFNKQIQLSWHRQGDELTVNVLVLVDSGISADWHRFSVVVLDAAGANAINPDGVPQLLSYRYFDFNGSEMTPSYEPEVVLMK